MRTPSPSWDGGQYKCAVRHRAYQHRNALYALGKSGQDAVREDGDILVHVLSHLQESVPELLNSLLEAGRKLLALLSNTHKEKA